MPAVIIGSHIDTVRNAGCYDGTLGVFAAFGVVETLIERGIRPRHPIDLVAFGDEEGVRFPTTLGGSRALAGTFDPASLAMADETGETLDSALRAFGCDPSGIAALTRPAGSVKAYLELHIEQGPVLEAEERPLGIVTAINGATRCRIRVTGFAGHAGTVPMSLRRDALAGAAEMILAIEELARKGPADDLVATVGRIETMPGAVNVIPGEARFTLDLRAPSDEVRRAALAQIDRECQAIAKRRNVGLAIEKFHDAPATACAPLVQNALAEAMTAQGLSLRYLPSGAGHDAMAMASLCPSGMLFVRCKEGISHNPAESITLEDAETAMAVMIEAVLGLSA